MSTLKITAKYKVIYRKKTFQLLEIKLDNKMKFELNILWIKDSN